MPTKKPKRSYGHSPNNNVTTTSLTMLQVPPVPTLDPSFYQPPSSQPPPAASAHPISGRGISTPFCPPSLVSLPQQVSASADDTARRQLSTSAPAWAGHPIPCTHQYLPSSAPIAPPPVAYMGQSHPPSSMPLLQQAAASAVDPTRRQMSTSASAWTTRPLPPPSASTAMHPVLSSSAFIAPQPAPWTIRHNHHIESGNSHSNNATPMILHPPLLPAVSSSAIAAASTAPSLLPSMQHPLTSTNQRKRSIDFIEQDDSANSESGANLKVPPTIAQQSVSRKTKQHYPLRSKHLPPVRVTKEGDTREKKIMRIVEKMMKLVERKKNYPEDSEHLDRLCELFQRFALLFYEKYVSEHGLEKRPLPTNADDHGGSYVFYYDNGDKHGKRDKRLTAGQTTNFGSRGKERIKKQRGGDGDITITKEEVEQQMALLLTTAECVDVANSPDFSVIFEEIVAMHFPRLACYANAGKEEKRRERIARGLIEGAVGASTGVFIDKAYEDFLEEPSDEIRRIISSPEVDPEYAECVGSIKCWLPFFTWEHFVSYLRRCAKKKEELSSDQIDFLRQVIIDLDREFLQKHIYDRTMGCEGVTIEPFVDAVPGKYNPRYVELMNVVEELRKVLPGPVMESFKEEGAIPPDVAESVKEIVNGISKDDYVSPSDDVLAEAYGRGLRSLKQQYRGRDDLAITMEFCVYDVICKDEGLQKELFGDCVPLEQDDIDGNTAEIFLRSDVGPSFRIIHSSHVGLGENQTDVQRVNSVQRTMATMTVNNQAGILSDEALEDERRTYCAFFMNFFGFGGSLNDRDGSFYLARSAAVGDGICSPLVVRAGAQMTGNVMGISGLATAFLRCLLGQDRFNAVLTSCGKPTNEGNPSPIDNPDQCEVWASERRREYDRQRYLALSEEERERNRERVRQRRNGRSEEEHERDRERDRQRYHGRSEEERERHRENDRQRYNNDDEYREKRLESRRKWYRELPQEKKNERRENERQRYRALSEEEKNEIHEKNRVRRAQKSQKRMADKGDLILKKAKAAYKQYLACRDKNRMTHFTSTDMKALLAYIVPNYPDPNVENDKPLKYKNQPQMMKRLGISLKDTSGTTDPLGKYFGKVDE